MSNICTLTNVKENDKKNLETSSEKKFLNIIQDAGTTIDYLKKRSADDIDELVNLRAKNKVTTAAYMKTRDMLKSTLHQVKALKAEKTEATTESSKFNFIKPIDDERTRQKYMKNKEAELMIIAQKELQKGLDEMDELFNSIT